MITTLSPEQIAAVCHAANAEYCRQIGDNTQLPWDEALEWQRASAVKGVEFALSNPDSPASAQHDSWLAQKKADGWSYGLVKDASAKTHPCMVQYDQLPIEQRLKDALFKAVVGAISV
jgi:hypothetical protein